MTTPPNHAGLSNLINRLESAFTVYAGKSLAESHLADLCREAATALQSLTFTAAGLEVDADSVVVPRMELARIEQARLDLFKMFPDVDTGMIIKLGKITDPMWEVANRKWPAAISRARG